MSTARHLIVRADGETIDAIVTMTAEEALLNTALLDAAGDPEAGVAVRIDPETDTGAVIDNGAVKYSAADGLISIADGTPAADFAVFDLAEVVAP